jgi:hypothetical protein
MASVGWFIASDLAGARNQALTIGICSGGDAGRRYISTMSY